MRTSVLAGLLPLAGSAAVAQRVTTHTITNVWTETETMFPRVLVPVPATFTTSTIKAKETIEVDPFHGNTAPLDPNTVHGPDRMSRTTGNHGNFSLIALPQNWSPNSDIVVDEDHNKNQTIGLRKFGKNIFITELIDNKRAHEKQTTYNLVDGRLQTDSKASDVKDTLYFYLLEYKHQKKNQNPRPETDGHYFPIWSTNKGKKHVHDNKIKTGKNWELVLDKNQGFYRLENSKLAGDWSYCWAAPSITQKGTMLAIGNDDLVHGITEGFGSLIYGNRDTIPEEWGCISYGIEAQWPKANLTKH